MPSSLASRPVLVNRPSRRLLLAIAVGACVVVLLLVIAAGHVLSAPAKVSSLTVQNPTAYDVDVSASGTPTGSVTDVGVVGAGTTVSFTDVANEGGDWYFHLSAQGVDLGTLHLTRGQLSSDGWRLTLDRTLNQRVQAVTGAAPVP
jgi:hypothetical protein